ncbi:MAG: hypothetical protein R2778_17540 [Saprospiraceae bacterium]
MLDAGKTIAEVAYGVGLRPHIFHGILEEFGVNPEKANSNNPDATGKLLIFKEVYMVAISRLAT